MAECSGKFLSKEFLYKMLLVRECDQRGAMLVRQGKCFFHVSSSGHEALGVLGYLLNSEDYIVPYYRDFSLMLIRGISIREYFLHLRAMTVDFSRGRSMTAHWNSRRLNILSHSSVVGVQCLPAAGIAWQIRLSNQGHVVTCSIGDGGTRQGEFYEAVCFACEKSLPLIFIVHDNGYATSMRTDELSPFKLGIYNREIIEEVDGTDPTVVFDVAKKVINHARIAKKPAILWCKLDRLTHHTSSDDQKIYRSEEELNSLKDPIKIYKNNLIAEKVITEEEFDMLETRAHKEVKAVSDEVYEIKERVDAKSVFNFLYAPENEKDLSFHSFFAEKIDQKMHMVEAINYTFNFCLRNNNKMIIFGEDVEDPLGGVFRFTKGLKNSFPNQVFNSPLAEATICGAAVGMGASGMSPVCELQFIDFVGPALNQIMNQVTTLRWRSGNDWQSPLVIYAPYGAYLPGLAIWHSQTNEAIFAHMPGIQIAIPSNPLDAAALFLSAIYGKDPTIILIPKYLMFKRIAIESFVPVEFGKGINCCQGDDVTIITWGNCVLFAKEAAKNLLQNHNISCEIIDLRTIVPVDWELILKSVEKTGRFIVVQEDRATASFGATIIQKVIALKFHSMKSPPKLLAGADLYNPFNWELAQNILPKTVDIETEVLKIMGLKREKL